MQASHVLSPRQRSAFLDVYRGVAVLLMMIFHFCWDLREFGFLSFAVHDPFWVYFRRAILLLFLSAIGWSAYLSILKTTTRKTPPLHWQRDGKLFASAAIISVVTYFAMPNQWIYFGILHFIFIASILTRPLVRWPLLSALCGAGIISIYQNTGWLHFPQAFSLITQYIPLPNRTLDIVFPFPWIGVVLIGPLLGYLGWQYVTLPQSILTRLLAFMGRHALPFYLLHQLILFSLVAVFKWLYINLI
ncbi:heparan-alpha-glucosaminide N-acetyltransferase [Marinomonas algarum]|uniref:DUF1624 domain-containing protein n=1 Tax=Marinomonas algarum TaxID=2883105 RepID=A0A9X1IL83_9GAMM|nr:heparan-alpha-glucosaminide N-acetyltransferase [Marinomonas algarum]MCB5161317.1 DUF1624 domain-containing protein [Marinomonas algarum]